MEFYGLGFNLTESFFFVRQQHTNGHIVDLTQTESSLKKIVHFFDY